MRCKGNKEMKSRHLLGIMQIILVTLKLLGLIDLSWVNVFIPTYIYLAILCLACLILIVIEVIEQKKRRY